MAQILRSVLLHNHNNNFWPQREGIELQKTAQKIIHKQNENIFEH